MAKKTDTKTPAKSEADAAHEKRVDLLQASVQKLVYLLHTKSRSLSERAIRARSLQPVMVEAAFQAVMDAAEKGLQDYRDAQGVDETGEVARVDLRALATARSKA